MPTEDELRAQFHAHESPATAAGGSIDLDAVLRRARTRRRPRLVAVAAVSSLAALAIVVPVSVSVALGHTGQVTASSGSLATTNRDSGHSAAGQQVPSAAPGGPLVGEMAPAQKLNLCTGPLAEPAPAPNGLVLTVRPVTAAATDRHIPATVTLTNTSTTPFSGFASPFPAVTLSRDGIVLWHSNGAVPSIAQMIDLPAGASTTFSTTFEPLACGVTDDTSGSFGADLPAVGAGDYQLSAVLDVSTGTGASVLVSGPTTVAQLH
jgi:hypothetical protein